MWAGADRTFPAIGYLLAPLHGMGSTAAGSWGVPSTRSLVRGDTASLRTLHRPTFSCFRRARTSA